MGKASNTDHKRLLSKFHSLCSVAKLSQEDKMAIIWGQGVESSADIGIEPLKDICRGLERQIGGKKYGELDRLRKRAMAAIGGWLTMAGRESNADLIKGIACRATGYDSFNKIPAERLRNLYYTFKNKQTDKCSGEALKKALDMTVVLQNYGRNGTDVVN